MSDRFEEIQQLVERANQFQQWADENGFGRSVEVCSKCGTPSDNDKLNNCSDCK